MKKVGKVRGLFLQSGENSQPHPLLGRGRLFPDPLAIVKKTTLAVLARILDNRQFMFDAHAVREPPQGKGRTNKIMKFPGAVKGRCIEINVIVDMGLVGMRTDKELILSLCPSHCRFITDTVCFFRRNLPGQKRLPDLKEQGPARYGPACLCKVLTFYQKKLGGSRVRVAEIGRYGSQLFRVHAIGETILHRLNCTFSRRCFIRADVGGRRRNPSFRQIVFLLWDTLSRSRKSRGAVSTTPRTGQSSTSAESCFKRSDSGPHKAA